jgi:hypothetical protein
LDRLWFFYFLFHTSGDIELCFPTASMTTFTNYADLSEHRFDFHAIPIDQSELSQLS